MSTPSKAKPAKSPAAPKSPTPKSPTPPDPMEMEGGRRSDLDGKFEADHRPSR